MSKRTSLETAAPSDVVVLATDIRVEQIKRLHGEICASLRTSVEKAIQIGELLTEVKASTPHGSWLPWLKANIPFSQPTAFNYMNCHKNRDKLLNVNNLAAAYKMLETLKDEKREASTKHDLMRVIQDARDMADKVLTMCNDFTERHGEIDGSIFKDLTDGERNDVKALISVWDQCETIMNVVKQSNGGKGKRRFFSIVGTRG